MRWMILCAALGHLVGCGPGDTGTDDDDGSECTTDVPAAVEMGVAGEGPIVDGADIEVDDGLQVGGSFVAIWLSVEGLDPEAPARIILTGVDANTSEELGSTEYTIRLNCSNTGEFAGKLVSPGLHLRISGLLADELDGREVILSVSIEDPDGRNASAEAAVTLFEDTGG